jgi:hypothetical protein
MDWGGRKVHAADLPSVQVGHCTVVHAKRQDQSISGLDIPSLKFVPEPNGDGFGLFGVNL